MVYGLQQMNTSFASDGLKSSLTRIYRESPSYKGLFSGWLINVFKSFIEVIFTNSILRRFQILGGESSNHSNSGFDFIKQIIAYVIPTFVTYPLDVVYVRRTQLFRENIGFFTLLYRMIKTDGVSCLYRGISYDLLTKIYISLMNGLIQPYLIIFINNSFIRPSILNILHQFILRATSQPLITLKYQIQGESYLVPDELKPRKLSLSQILKDFHWNLWNGGITLFYWTVFRVLGMKLGKSLSTSYFMWYNTEEIPETPLQRILQHTSLEELKNNQLTAPKYTITIR